MKYIVIETHFRLLGISIV